MRGIHVVATLAIVGSMAGCVTSTVDTGLERSRRVVRDDFVLGFGSGLLMVERVSPVRMCRGEVARVVTGMSPGNFLVQTLTAGIISPRSVAVTCAHAADELPIAVRYPRNDRRWREMRMERLEMEMEKRRIETRLRIERMQMENDGRVERRRR